jgi:hypothetical protein
VQALPLSGVCTQFPVDESQDAEWHASDAVQDFGVPAHTPLWQVYVWHLSGPVHGVPLAAAGLEHVPVEGLQVPAVWQASDAVQTTGLLPVHTPAWHV